MAGGREIGTSGYAGTNDNLGRGSSAAGNAFRSCSRTGISVSQNDGQDDPYESRDSRTDLCEHEGKVPSGHSTHPRVNVPSCEYIWRRLPLPRGMAVNGLSPQSSDRAEVPGGWPEVTLAKT